MFDFNTETNEIWVYDEIGPSWWGLIDAASVMTALDGMKGQRAKVRLNTPGGSVDEGIAIFNAMKDHPGGVDVYVDSLAASMGSYLLQAGENRYVANNAMVMIHDPWSIAIGNSTDMRKQADMLDKYAARMIPDYAAASGQSEDEVKAIMLEETWLTGPEAVEAGFADSVIERESVEPVTAGLHKIARKAPASLCGTKAAGDRKPYPVHREAARIAARANSRTCR